jgi:hypothetical protein
VIWRASIIWLLIAAAEVLNGIMRVRWLNRRMGDRRARQVGVFSGSVLILTIAWWAVPWIGVRSLGELLGVGAVWLALMLAFDIAVGRLVFRAPWKRIAADFDLRKGGFLGVGMLLLFLAPLLVAQFRGDP